MSNKFSSFIDFNYFHGIDYLYADIDIYYDIDENDKISITDVAVRSLQDDFHDLKISPEAVWFYVSRIKEIVQETHEEYEQKISEYLFRLNEAYCDNSM